MGELLTITDLCRILSEPQHVVEHALERHGPLPARRVGIIRIWTPDHLEAIRESLRKTAVKSTDPRRRREVCA